MHLNSYKKQTISYSGVIYYTYTLKNKSSSVLQILVYDVFKKTCANEMTITSAKQTDVYIHQLD